MGLTEAVVIVIGGGSAGLVLASRLSAARPDLDITVIERGSSTFDQPATTTPGLCVLRVLTEDPAMHYVKAKPSERLSGREVVVPVGKAVGGGSAVNLMFYSRPAACDFDGWQQEGWTAKDMLPLLRKIEDYQVEGADPAVHGVDGPLKVSRAWSFSIGQEWLEAASAAGDNAVEHDMADWEQKGSTMSMALKWIDEKTGKRSDVASAYLVPQLVNPRLRLLTESTVHRILFEGDKAVGVEYAKEGESGVKVVKARKWVVCSAGALETPLLLERSGIGGQALLERHGIKTVVDLPGVGAEYHDHPLTLTSYYAAPDCETGDSYWQDAEGAKAEAEERYKQAQGVLATNYQEAGARWRPSDTELAQMKASSKSFADFWDAHFARHPSRPLMLRSLINVYGGPPDTAEPGPHFTNSAYAAFPASVGSVHISSADPKAAPDFDAGYFTHEADIVAHVWSYKRGREIARRQASYRGEVQAMHPTFPKGSSAACARIDAAPKNVKNLPYSADDDKAIEAFVKERINSAWHGMGTAPMRPREQGGVVDARLNAHGTRNLKVADLSIAPGPLTANTYAAACAIGEKAALLMLEDLKV